MRGLIYFLYSEVCLQSFFGTRRDLRISRGLSHSKAVCAEDREGCEKECRLGLGCRREVGGCWGGAPSGYGSIYIMVALYNVSFYVVPPDLPPPLSWCSSI